MLNSTTKGLLIVEDDPGLQSQLKWSFEEFDPLIAGTRSEAIGHLRRERPAVVITDLGLPPDPGGSSEGFALVEEIMDFDPGIKVIVVTGREEKDNAVRAIGLGAYDFYQKPIDVDMLKFVVERAFRLATLEQENRKLMESQAGGHPDEMVGSCPQMQEVLKTVGKVASTSVAVLVLGETGTGKGELVKALHAQSDRSDGKLVTINCTSIPESLLESELFGHEKGAFTGAVNKKIGKIEYASGGTLFLDEIGDMPVPLQAKILHVLQEKKIVRLGGNEEIPVDVRIVCATHQDLKQYIQGGQFREDLYYRISEIVVELPPLRERGGDIVLLAQKFLHRYAAQQDRVIKGFSKEALKALQAYNWPGNIRELENRIKRAVVMVEKPTISVSDLELDALSESYVPTLLRDVRAQAEIEAITMTLMNSKTISEAASSLGVTRPTLYNLIAKYELENHLAGKQDQNA